MECRAAVQDKLAERPVGMEWSAAEPLGAVEAASERGESDARGAAVVLCAECQSCEVGWAGCAGGAGPSAAMERSERRRERNRVPRRADEAPLERTESALPAAQGALTHAEPSKDALGRDTQPSSEAAAEAAEVTREGQGA